jgi:hypothetical protein
MDDIKVKPDRPAPPVGPNEPVPGAPAPEGS